MPARFASYPAYSAYSAGHWPQQLHPAYAQYPQAYAWGYPPYAQYPAPAMGAPYPPYPASPGHRGNRRRRSITPPPEIQVHALLGGAYQPTAIWDVTQEPSTARHTPHRGSSQEKITEAILAGAATDPPVHSMRIVSDSFEWVIVIGVPRGDVVTVKHVFTAIYGTLQESLERDEWDDVSSNVKRAMHKTRGLRLARSPTSYKVDSHVIKGDILGERTFFHGIKPVGPPEDPTEWLLKLGSPPKQQGRR